MYIIDTVSCKVNLDTACCSMDIRHNMRCTMTTCDVIKIIVVYLLYKCVINMLLLF